MSTRALSKIARLNVMSTAASVTILRWLLNSSANGCNLIEAQRKNAESWMPTHSCWMLPRCMQIGWCQGNGVKTAAEAVGTTGV